MNPNRGRVDLNNERDIGELDIEKGCWFFIPLKNGLLPPLKFYWSKSIGRFEIGIYFWMKGKGKYGNFYRGNGRNQS